MRTSPRDIHAAVAVTLGALTLASCTPEPIRRSRDDGPTVAPAVSVSPQLPRAQPPPDPEPIAAAPPDEPARSSPPPAAREPTPSPPSETSSQPAPAADWWLHEPAPEPGRLRMVVSATADSLRDARRAAVDEGLRRIQRAAGAPPVNLRYELTSVQRDAPGVYRGYVLISCDAP